MTRLERYKDKLNSLYAQRSKLLRSGRFADSLALNNDIMEVEYLIKKAEDYEEQCDPKPLKDLVSKEELDKMGIIPLMIEAHLAADFLTEVAYMVVEICNANGFRDVSLMPDLKELIKKSELFASFLTKVSPELCDLLVRNETLNEALHKKYKSYINQRLK